MAAPSVTYTFSNSTTADATQVNQNFTDIINGVSDGTKDLSINALTCAGNVNLNGNTTLGNATTDVLTATGYWGSSLIPGSHNTYDLGLVTTNGWRYLYLASSSSTKTCRITGSATSSDLIFTLHTTAGTLAIRERCSFAATTSTTAATTSSPFVFTVEDHDSDGAYNTSDGKFTVPSGKGGVYFFGARCYTGSGSGNELYIYKNGSLYTQGSPTFSVSTLSTVYGCLTLVATDVIDIRPGANGTASGGSTQQQFFGFKIAD